MHKSKKRIAAILCGMWLAMSTVLLSASAATNLIQNPTLTSATVSSSSPDGWMTGAWGNAAGAVFSFPASTTPPIDIGNADQLTIGAYGTSTAGGAAEWYFNPVSITGGSIYTFSDEYLSNAPSYLVAGYTVPTSTTDCAASQGICYFTIATLPSSNGVWASSTQTLTAPVDATAMTMYHLLQSAGSLSVGNYSLSLSTTQNQAFPQGMVSLSFDDGWESQYTYGLPVLKAAAMPGTFYIISNAMLGAASSSNPNILCSTSEDYCDGAQLSQTSSTWTAAGQYPDPLFPGPYTLSESYTSSANVSVTISYYDGNGAAISGEQNILLATLPAAASARSTSTAFTIPANVWSLVSTSTNASNPNFTIAESVPAGQSLSVQGPSLVEDNPTDTYMDTAQVAAMQAAGEEIGAHTMDHCDLVMLENNSSSATIGGDLGPPAGACASQLAVPTTPAQEIDGSRSALTANGMTPVDTIAYPYGSYDANIEALAKADGFVGARSVVVGFNSKTTDPYALQNQIVDATTTFASNGLSQVEGWINTVATSKSWLILTFHNVEPSNILTENRDTDGTTPDFLQSIVSYLKSQNVCVVTVHQGMQAMGTSAVNPCGTTVTPPPPPPPMPTSTLTIKVNLSGGTSTLGAFLLSAKSGTSTLLQNSAAVATQTFVVNQGAAYAVTEATTTNSINYTIGSSGCSGTASALPAVCTFTDTVIPSIVVPSSTPTSTVRVAVVNNNAGGGTALPSAFTVTVAGGHPTPASFAGSGTAVPVTIDAGTAYAVNESAVANYTTTKSSGCSGTPVAGGTATCTITNTYQAVIATSTPKATTSTVSVIVINNNGTGGTALPSAFTVIVTGGGTPTPAQFAGSTTPVQVTLTGNFPYVIIENPVTGYTTSMSTGCAGVVATGKVATCTITNTYGRFRGR